MSVLFSLLSTFHLRVVLTYMRSLSLYIFVYIWNTNYRTRDREVYVYERHAIIESRCQNGAQKTPLSHYLAPYRHSIRTDGRGARTLRLLKEITAYAVQLSGTIKYQRLSFTLPGETRPDPRPRRKTHRRALSLALSPALYKTQYFL